METLSYGSEGLQRVVQGYERQVRNLEKRHEGSESKEVSKAIEQLKSEIGRLHRELAAAPPARFVDAQSLSSCSMSYGGDAYAGPRSGGQGVAATASAYFHNDCGHQGDTFATAYAHAVDGTLETTSIRNDSNNSGSWIDSHTSATAGGSTGCESSAQGSVSIGALGIYYQTPFRQNFECPAPVEKTSIYTLDSTAWEQTGTGNLGPLTLTGTVGYTLIDSNYNPIATSGLPQAGIAFHRETAYLNHTKLEGERVDSVAAYADASVIKIEFTARFPHEVESSTAVLLGLAHYDGSTYSIDGGTLYGVQIGLVPRLRVVAQIMEGRPNRSDPNLNHYSPESIDVYSPDDSYRWVWTESSPGSATGTGQWWRKVSGIWQLWGPSKPNLWRPVGHASTRMRIFGSHAGYPPQAGVEFLHASITLGTQPASGQLVCTPE